MIYRGRFAPSPTGPLHFGSLVSALASWLDARAQHGAWLVRIDDIDGPRTAPGAAEDILATLERFGMRADEPPVWQSRRAAQYARAFAQLQRSGLVYPCGCTRKEIADSLLHAHAPHTTLAYPGTCRSGLHGKPARAWPPARARRRRRGNHLRRSLATQADAEPGDEVGDFGAASRDDQWAYQLAVVVDDADAGNHAYRARRGSAGFHCAADYLQRCLGVPTPSYLHVPVVNNDLGEKLSKQTGASALDASRPLDALLAAARHLGLELNPSAQTSLDTFYAAATPAWASRMRIITNR